MKDVVVRIGTGTSVYTINLMTTIIMRLKPNHAFVKRALKPLSNPPCEPTAEKALSPANFSDSSLSYSQK
jgi:hypothetical protein